MPLVVDSTGLSVFGEGEWAAAKHGDRGKRGWKKLHLGVDRSGVIVAQALSEPTADDATTGVGLVTGISGDVASVTADGGSTRPCARTKVLGCGTIRDKAGLSGTKPRCLLWFWGGAAARWGSRLLSRGFPPFGDSRGGLGTVLTPGKACLKGLAALTTTTTQATIQAQMKPSSSWWRGAEPSRSASSAVGAVCANVQTPRCSRSADGWWPLGVREPV